MEDGGGVADAGPEPLEDAGSVSDAGTEPLDGGSFPDGGPPATDGGGLFDAGTGSGNYDPAFVVNASDYIYIDLNAATDGTGLTPASPRNRVPGPITDRKQVFFNADNGVQRLPPADVSLSVTGSDVQISSYSATPGKMATVSAYRRIQGGWTLISGTVYRRSYDPGVNAGGPIVGNVVDLSDTSEWESGTVLNWTDLSAGARYDAFIAAPAGLALGSYAYDYVSRVLYVNVGADPNGRPFGVASVGRFIDSTATSSRVTVHDLRIEGFAKVGVNIKSSTRWRVHHNKLYGIGGAYHTTNNWYYGTGVQVSGSASDIEVDGNFILQTYDSPISPQHFAGAQNDNKSIKRINIHDNYLEKWALAGVELAVWADNCNFEDIQIVNNVMVNGGAGFSKHGDDGDRNDGIHVIGGAHTGDVSTFTKSSGAEAPLVIRNNYINAFNHGVDIRGMYFPNPTANKIIIDGNTIWGHAPGSTVGYGIRNIRAADACISSTRNHYCFNDVNFSDANPQGTDVGSTTGMDCAAP